MEEKDLLNNTDFISFRDELSGLLKERDSFTTKVKRIFGKKRDFKTDIALIIENRFLQREKLLSEDIVGLENELEYLNGLIGDKKEEIEKGFFAAQYAEAVTKQGDVNFKEVINESKDKKTKVSEAAWGMGGGYYLAYSEEEREYFVKAARDKVQFSPFMRNIKNIIKSAVLSDSLKIDIPQEQVDIVVAEILKINNFDEKLKKWIPDTFVDSEKFVTFFINKDGNILLREVDPLDIEEIIYHPKDRETIIGYKQHYTTEDGDNNPKEYQDAFLDESKKNTQLDWSISLGADGIKDDELMLYFRYGHRVGERGEIPLLPALRYDRIYEEIILDLARLYHERAKVIWILRIKGKESKDFSRTTKPVRGGTIKIETDNKTWRIENPRLADHTSKEYGSPHKGAIAASVGLPAYLIFADTSNQSYASLRKGDSPYNLTIKMHQSFWSDNIQRLIRVIIKELVKRKKLPEEVTIAKIPAQDASSVMMEVMSVVNAVDTDQKKVLEGMKMIEAIETKYKVKLQEAEVKPVKVKIKTVNLPVNVIFPRQESDNPLLMAQALGVFVNLGIMSLRTARKKIGLDADLEAALILAEPAPEEPANVKKKTGKAEQPETNQSRKLDRGQQ